MKEDDNDEQISKDSQNIKEEEKNNEEKKDITNEQNKEDINKNQDNNNENMYPVFEDENDNFPEFDNASKKDNNQDESNQYFKFSEEKSNKKNNNHISDDDEGDKESNKENNNEENNKEDTIRFSSLKSEGQNENMDKNKGINPNEQNDKENDLENKVDNIRESQNKKEAEKDEDEFGFRESDVQKNNRISNENDNSQKKDDKNGESNNNNINENKNNDIRKSTKLNNNNTNQNNNKPIFNNPIRNPYISNNFYNNNNNNNGNQNESIGGNYNQTTMFNFNHNPHPEFNEYYPGDDQPIPGKGPDPKFELYEELPEDNDGFDIDPEKGGSDSSTSAGIQIANTIMGAGILSIPLIMRYFGFLIGVIFVVFLALSTYYSVFILIKCQEITGKNGFSMFAKITMGKAGSMLVKIIIIINNLGLCIAYFRIFGEVSRTILQAFVSPDSYWMTNWHNYLFILFGAVILFFFIFIKNISTLKKVSYLGVIAVLIFTISLIILFFYKQGKGYIDSNISWKFFAPNCSFKEAFHSAPSSFIAFLFQFNIFPIYFSMKHRTLKSMLRASKIGIGYSLINFLLVGIVGFLLYGLSIEDSILDNLYKDMDIYRNTNVAIIALIIIISISFIITCLSSFPVLFLSLRVNYINSMIVCLKACDKSNDERIVEISQGRQHKKEKNVISNKMLNIVTLFLYIIIILLALIVYSLKTIFILVGATAGAFIGFILPNLFFIKITKMAGKNNNLFLPIFYLALGIFSFLVAILVSLF